MNDLSMKITQTVSRVSPPEVGSNNAAGPSHLGLEVQAHHSLSVFLLIASQSLAKEEEGEEGSPVVILRGKATIPKIPSA